MSTTDTHPDPQDDPAAAVDDLDERVLGEEGTDAQDRTVGEDTNAPAHEQDLDSDELGSANGGAAVSG